MANSLIIYQQGVPIVIEAFPVFIGTGSEGTPGACRRLVFPPALSPLLAPIIYQTSAAGSCLNPTRTFNFDKSPLFHPITRTQLTIGSTRDLRFTTAIEDVIVTELWDGSDQESSMPTSFFRLLYEYLINSPPFVDGQTNFIVWEPRDRSTTIYNVSLLSLTVGGAQDETRFDIVDLRDPGGLTDGGNIENAVDSLNTLPTGLIDREVRLRMRIISEAS